MTELREEDWKDDDFLSFGAKVDDDDDEEEKVERLQAAARAETLPHHQRTDTTVLPPWMNEPFPHDMNPLNQCRKKFKLGKI
eukprot:scaffold2897_cov178-Amphora_coffeaeformis.AAC.15